MLAQHRHTDEQADAAAVAGEEARAARKLARQQQDAERLRDWLARHPDDKIGSRGRVLKSNRTDHDSAKMATSHGVIQGYAGYHSDANMTALEAAGINALVADTGMRQRDERFATPVILSTMTPRRPASARRANRW